MVIILLFVVALATCTVRSANIIDRLSVQDGAICDDRIPAYLVVDSHKLVGSDNKVIYKDVEEQDCKNMCTDNKDEQGNQIMCSSYTYNTKDRACSVHRGKAMPVGKLELKPAPGHRYYEKFCLPEGTPAACGEAPFFRANQAVLIGFAKNVSHTKNMATCIQACIEMSAECRSAMFFGTAGECILNVASAQDAPDVFAEEEDEENVVYFENGCVLENQIRGQKRHSASKQNTLEAKKLAPGLKLTVNSTNNLKSANASRVSEDKKEPKASPSERKKAKASEEDEAVTVRTKKPQNSEEDGGGNDDDGDKGAGDDSQESSTKPSRRGGSGKTPTPRHRGSTSSSSKNGSGGGPKRLLLKNATLSNGVEDAWGPWSEDCRSFDERRPCQNGNRVGFQSRQCLRTPFECQGPFFRYCIAPC